MIRRVKKKKKEREREGKKIDQIRHCCDKYCTFQNVTWIPNSGEYEHWPVSLGK